MPGLLQSFRDIENWEGIDHQLLNSFLETSDQAIVVTDVIGDVVVWNSGAETIFGFSTDEAYGQHISKVCCAEEKEPGKLWLRLKAAVKDGKQQYSEWYVSKNGQRFFADTTIRPLYNDDNTIKGFLSVSREITQQKLIAEENRLLSFKLDETNRREQNYLAENGINTGHANSSKINNSSYVSDVKKTDDLRDKLMLVTEVAGIGVWQYDLKDKYFLIDQTIQNIYGVKDGNCYVSLEMWMYFIHPEDKERVSNAFRLLTEEYVEFSIDFRIIDPCSTVKFIEAVALIVRDDSGLVQKIIGTNRDKTVERKAEIAIKESEEKYRTIFENSSDGILLTIPNGNIIAANPAACTMFQMTEEEICFAGRDSIIDSADPRIQTFFRERRIKGKAKGELTLKRKDGSKFIAELSSVIYKNNSGQERVSTIIRDTTEQRKAATEIATATKALENTLNELQKIMDSSLDIICSIDVEGRFIKVSSACEYTWGYKPEELEGRRYIDLVYEEDIDKTNRVASEIMEGVSFTMFENRYKRKDGSIIPILWSAKWDNDDKIMYCVAKDGSEKKRLEEVIEQERSRFEEMFLCAPASVGYFKGKEHVFEMANPLYLELTGRDDIIGKKVRDVFPEIENQGLFELLDHVFETGETFVAKERLVQIIRKNSTVLEDVYLNFVYQAYRSNQNKIEGIFFFAIDVTEQVKSRKEIEKNEKKLRQILETAQEGIWMIDENNKTVFVNKKMCEMLEYSEEEMLEKSEIFFQKADDKTITFPELYERGNDDTTECRFETKTGKTIWTNISANSISDKDGGFKGSLAMVTDITLRKAQQLEIKKIAEERELLITELTRSLKDLKQFTYITSHNFRAPLSNLMGLLTLVDYEGLGEKNREILEMFKSSTNQLNKTINDLMQILIIKNNSNVQFEDIRIKETLQETKLLLHSELEQCNCEIVSQLDVENVYFNKTYLQSILVNLFSNAVRYRVKDRPLKIEIQTIKKDPGYIMMTIKDNGLGIDLKRHKDNIFGMYQRFHSNSTGAGLGLFIVKSQIDALGAKIDVESSPNHGTAFHLTFRENVQAC